MYVNRLFIDRQNLLPMKLAAFWADMMGQYQLLTVGTGNQIDLGELLMGSSLFGNGSRYFSCWYGHGVSIDK
jgi:hypothetical protein